MLVVETELKISPIAGIGVFARGPAAKGALVWTYDERIDRTLDPRALKTLPDHVRQALITHTTWHEGRGVHVVWGDNAKFLNHADDPNLAFAGAGFEDAVAARDIAAGEELTADYRVICDHVRMNGNRF